MDVVQDFTYIDGFTCPIVGKAILLVVLRTQIVGNVEGKRFQVEGVLRDYYAGTFQLLVGTLCDHLHVRVARTVHLNWQGSVITR